MRDNGLLKCYSNFSNQYGLLEISKLGEMKFKDNIMQLTDNQGIFNGMYYAKTCYLDRMQLEVLISQIVADFGVDTAIYLPGVYSGSFAVVSNDVKGEKGESLYNYLNKCKSLDAYFKSPYKKHNKYSTDDIKFNSWFTQKGLKEYVDAHIIRTACGDIDGHAGNMIVRAIDDIDGSAGKIDSLSLLDYGWASQFLYSINKEGWHFDNGLGGGFEKTRDGMIEVFKNNEIVQDFYSSSEIAEKLGNIDVHKHVVDIKDCIGLEISTNIESEMARNIDYIAEGMIK